MPSRACVLGLVVWGFRSKDCCGIASDAPHLGVSKESCCCCCCCCLRKSTPLALLTTKCIDFPMDIQTALTAGRAAGDLPGGQLVPVLLKAARSGSTWTAAVLKAVSGRPFYLELFGTPGALQLQLVRAGVGFSTNPVATDNQSLADPRSAWAAFGRATLGRAAIVVLHRTNVVKHAISFLRVPDAHAKCGGVKSAGCTALQPSAIDVSSLREVLQCVHLHEHRLDTLARHVTAVGVPGLTISYEELQADLQRASARLASLLRVPHSAAPARRLRLIETKAWPNDMPTKTGTDDLSQVLSNFEEVATWLRNRSTCLERQLRAASHEAESCENPWAGEPTPLRCSNTMLGLGSRSKRVWGPS